MSENGTALIAIIRPARDVDSFFVYFKYNDYPNNSYYDWFTVVPNPDPTLDNYQKYMVMPPQNFTALNGTYRFAISLNGMSW